MAMTIRRATENNANKMLAGYLQDEAVIPLPPIWYWLGKRYEYAADLQSENTRAQIAHVNGTFPKHDAHAFKVTNV